MPSEFQHCLEQIKKIKCKDIGDIKKEIINELLQVYANNTTLFLTVIKRGGFPTYQLRDKEPLDTIIEDFFDQCTGLNRDELYKIFSELYDRNKGISLLKGIRDTLIQFKHQSTDTPTYTPLPKTSLPLIPSPPTKLSTGTKKILFLSANPKGTSQLRLDEEIREIKEGLRRSKKREGFAIETGHAVRYREIRRAILDSGPNIVHFSGHGLGDEGLVFEDEAGQQKLVGAEALAGLFKLFADQIECVVLNVCYSEVQARAIVEHIPFVVGMNKAIGDRAAIEFAIGFYNGLGAGKTVEFAYKLGCNSIEIAGIPEHLTPQLLRKNSIDIFSIDIPKKDSPTLATLYKNLEEYLKNEQWKEADLETMEILIEIADSIESPNQLMKDRDIITWLELKDIDKIPDEALKTIDKLWVKYSKGHFGFSVQAKIWTERECQGKQGKFDFIIYQNKFAKSIGWYDGRKWINRYDNFDFSVDAKRGHLPSLSFPNQKIREITWSRWKETFERFFPRLFHL